MKKRLIAWVSIPAADLDRAVKFYGTVLGIEFETYDCGGGVRMACFPTGEGEICCSPDMKPSKEGTMVSLAVPDSIEASIVRAETLGGAVVVPKTKIEAEGLGYFAVLADTEGNLFGLYE
ncbi:MAG: VOC family protein [Bacteroidales bacterium]|jgi:predicted enzyme related to lactoylglutathione lyase|nr:VOC family protein [Bacteroidales bacterium]